MRRTYGTLLLTLLLALPLGAQEAPVPDPTATGGGLYYVVVDGDTVSQHTTERIASARAFEALARCSWLCTVTYRQDYLVRMGVRWVTPDEVEEPEPEPTDPGDLVFHSTWSTALGSGDAAVMDGGRWDEALWCGGARYYVMDVVEGEPLGWTGTPNVFRIRHTGVDGDCGAITKEPVVPASTIHWGRFYFRGDLDGWGGAMHNFSYQFVGNIQGVWFRPNGGDDRGWRLNFGWCCNADGVLWASTPDWHVATGWQLKTGPGNPTNLSDGSGHSDPRAIHLDHGAWYRYEWQMEYVTPTTFRFWPRVYDLAGTLLYDADDFWLLWHSDGSSLRQWYEAGNVWGVGDVEMMRNLGIGNEGRAGGSAAEWYVADFGISTTGWIGG